MDMVYSGKIIRVYAGEVELPWKRKAFREYVEHPGAAVILAKKGGKIILLRQYRYPVKEWILELPAGTIEPGEDPLDTAIRELEEETGLKALEMDLLGWFYTSPGISTERMYVFYTENVEKGSLKRDVDELIQILEVEETEVLKMIENGQIRDGKTIATLMLYLLKKDELNKAKMG